MRRASGAIVLLVSLGAGVLAGIAVAIVSAITLALVDIYLSGHGRHTLARPWISEGFVRMSRADALMLGAATMGALGTVIGVFLGGRRIQRRRARSDG